MKHKLSITALAAIILVCMGVTLRNLGPADDGYRSAKRKAWIKKFDKDGDGRLNKEEKSVAEEEQRERERAWMKKFDTNGDGEITREEKEAASNGKKSRKK